jgi:hypothetical protein
LYKRRLAYFLIVTNGPLGGVSGKLGEDVSAKTGSIFQKRD